MKQGLERIWSEHPCGLLKKLVVGVYKQYRSHVMEAINSKVKELNAQLLMISGGLTSEQ